MKLQFLLELTDTKSMQTDLDAEAKRLADGGGGTSVPPQQPLNGGPDTPEPNPQIDTSMGGSIPSNDAPPTEDMSDGSDAVEDEEVDDEPDEEVDGDLVSSLKDQPYVKDYEHNDSKSPLDPIKIAGMALDSLYQLKTQVEFQINKTTLSNNDDMSDDDSTDFYQDLLKYVSATIEYRKTEVRNNDDKMTGNTRPEVARQNKSSDIKYGDVKPDSFKESDFSNRFKKMIELYSI